jgi:uncharacterized protein
MVLITPKIEVDDSNPFGGNLVVSFPDDSECTNFKVPLNPTSAVLQDWEMCVPFLST